MSKSTWLIFCFLHFFSSYTNAEEIKGNPPKFSENVKNVKIVDQMPLSKSAIFNCADQTCTITFHAIPAQRGDVTMNAVVLEDDTKPKVALLIIAGTGGADGRIYIKGLLAPKFGAMQYLFENADLFLKEGISLVATGCPTDQVNRFGDCTDDYRKSMTYANDFKKIIELLRDRGYQKFYVFGHSSGGISSRWLSVNLPDEFSGVINSSIMNGTAMNLASSTLGFDMTKIKAPVLNIAHEDDQCPSTPYFIVKNYSHNNLVTVKGGGSSGPLCEGTNHHSFEGRQRGVSRAIAKWMTTGQVQAVVDSDD